MLRASIWLEFGAHIGSLKANISVKFGVDLINIHGAVSDFTSEKCLLVVKNQSSERQQRCEA